MKKRRGYQAEYKFRQKIKKEGKFIVKLAIGEVADYIIIKPNKLEIWEVKEGFGKRFYPSPREKKQIEKIKVMAKKNKIHAYLIYYPKEKRLKKVIYKTPLIIKLC